VSGPDEQYVGVSTGGGGYGDPLDRDPKLVRADVRDGFISRECARAIYGAVVADDYNAELLEAETAAARHGIRRRRGNLPIVSLEGPAAGPESLWAERNRRDGDVYLVNPVA
jgi:N-methylhydantoinase B